MDTLQAATPIPRRGRRRPRRAASRLGASGAPAERRAGAGRARPARDPRERAAAVRRRRERAHAVRPLAAPVAGPRGWRGRSQGSSSPLGSHGFQNLTLLMCAGYALVLRVRLGAAGARARGGDRGRPRDPAARAAAASPRTCSGTSATRGWAPCTGSTPTRTSRPKRPRTRSSRSSAGPSSTPPTARCSRSAAMRSRRSGWPAACGR